MRKAGDRPRLEVYVSRHCFTCGVARRLARQAAVRFPGVDVRLIDIDEAGQIPEQIVAVPTYTMNGKVISLGNPEPQDLFARLVAAVA